MSTKTLYVGNLNYATSEDSLTEAFGDFLPQRVRILEGKGFGFVDVPEDQMQAAIDAMNGQELDGRTLRVNEARPREDRPRQGGGGYGGGGGGGYGGGGGRDRDRDRDRGGRGNRW